MTLDCPICNTSLTQRSIEGQTIDECVSCNGAWYDSSELSTILRTASDLNAFDQSNVDPPETIKCPRCATKVVSSIYAHDSGIAILKCASCSGVWLTAGQLDRIAQYRNGPHKTDRLGQALAETYAESNRQSRLIDLLQSRLLSLAFATVILILAAVLRGGNIADVLRLLAFLLLSLACIWFSDSMGRSTGGRIRYTTPGVAVALGGWILMFVVFGVVIYSAFNR